MNEKKRYRLTRDLTEEERARFSKELEEIGWMNLVAGQAYSRALDEIDVKMQDLIRRSGVAEEVDD